MASQPEHAKYTSFAVRRMLRTCASVAQYEQLGVGTRSKLRLSCESDRALALLSRRGAAAMTAGASPHP
jgi:hypothetical protein